jgi:pimeloyl-ACP methyl ester carboxylesterase
MVLIHGFAESRMAWRAWIPSLAQRFRVVSLDLRGFGESTAMPQDFAWSMQVMMDDLHAFMASLGTPSVHVLGAKSGGSFALEFASRFPEMVKTVMAVTPPVIAADGVQTWIEDINSHGVLAWAAKTMRGRLGSKVTQQEIDWWVNCVQGKTSKPSLLGYLAWIPNLDIRQSIQRILPPSLVITTTGSGLRSVESVKAWHATMNNSTLHVIQGDAWHAAGAYPELCASLCLEFIDQNKKAMV